MAPEPRAFETGDGGIYIHPDECDGITLVLEPPRFAQHAWVHVPLKALVSVDLHGETPSNASLKFVLKVFSAESRLVRSDGTERVELSVRLPDAQTQIEAQEYVPELQRRIHLVGGCAVSAMDDDSASDPLPPLADPVRQAPTQQQPPIRAALAQPLPQSMAPGAAVAGPSRPAQPTVLHKVLAFVILAVGLAAFVGCSAMVIDAANEVEEPTQVRRSTYSVEDCALLGALALDDSTSESVREEALTEYQAQC